MNQFDKRGFPPLLEEDHPYIFVDTCMQAWPDADYANAHKVGCTAFAVTAWEPNVPPEQALEETMAWHHFARHYPNLSVATSVQEIRDAKRDGRAVFIITSQDGDFLSNRIEYLELFWRLGLRIMLPVYNSTNLLGDGCLDSTDRGLTRFGHAVVAEANRLGIVLDGTHTGKRTTMDMMAASEDPVIFSHSNPSALFPSPRNIDDEQILACHETGGVIGVVPWGPLVVREGSPYQPRLTDLLDAVDYIADLTGTIDSVAIGTDFSIGTYGAHGDDLWGKPISLAPLMERYTAHTRMDLNAYEGFTQGFAVYPHITNFIAGMEERGYSTDDIAKVVGENHLRVFERVWKTEADL